MNDCQQPHTFDNIKTCTYWIPFSAGNTLKVADDAEIVFHQDHQLSVFLCGEDQQYYHETNNIAITPHTILMGALVGYGQKVFGATDLETEHAFLADTIRLLAEKVFHKENLGDFLIGAAHWLRRNASIWHGRKALETAMRLAPFHAGIRNDYIGMSWEAAEDEPVTDCRQTLLEELIDTYQHQYLNEVGQQNLEMSSYFFCSALGILGRWQLPMDQEWYATVKRNIVDDRLLQRLNEAEVNGFSMEKCRLGLSTEVEEQTSRMALPMIKTDWINREYVEAFKKGDRIGLPFEGCTMFQQEQSSLFGSDSVEITETLMEVYDGSDQGVRESILSKIQEKRLKMALKSNRGSDESSIVDSFINFVEGYTYTSMEQFAWDWVNYHQNNHGTGYGRTMRDHFSLVAHIRRHDDIYPDLKSKLSKILEIATDADSYGNGCLALVYPAYCYAITLDEDPAEFVRYLTGLTHSHEDAMEAVTRFCLFIEDPSTIVGFFMDTGAKSDEIFRQRFCTGHATAFNTLVTAVKCAMKNMEMDVIREAVRIGGDVDSVLATAMLIWKLRTGGAAL